MQDDVMIGKGDKGTSAVRVFAIAGEHSISHNKTSFWINDCFLGMGMTIFRHTPQGIELQGMIERACPLAEIQDWLTGVILRHIDTNKLRQRIEQAQTESFEAGRRAKAEEIMSALTF